jgi:CheY-like chemotaxis protein
MWDCETMPPTDDDRLRILLAEDVEDHRLLLRLYLEGQHIDLVMAVDGVEAVDAFRNGPDFDLVLMDMQMPRMGGLAATREIREIERHLGRERTPVLALTADAREEEAQRMIEAGCDAHLTKPIRKENLVAAIARYARRGPP